MNIARWQRTDELFAAALAQEPAQRNEFLQAACADDLTLRTEVESLLAAHANAANFIEAPAAAFATDLLPEVPAAAHEGKRCGPYRLMREIGHGGMGEVYLAERDDDQYQKQVAIKLVRRGMNSDSIIRRFLSERQILAGLDHPNIARLLDGGTTEDGLPWLALEYIEGQPLTEYCDEHQLSIVERLRLFRAVCAAVHYAHQNLVIHRDLKPSNILVTEDGVPKLLDFGIAKIFDPELHEHQTEQTLTAVGLMTPGYASPEQIKRETITTASDVYSLGLILYELLSGHRPYHVTGRSPQEIERIVCELAPSRPSLAVVRPETMAHGETENTITPEQVSRARNDQPERLRRRLAGDLDNIVLKALRKERERRYASVEQFAEDIRHHLDGLSVTASSDTFAYRSAKFVRRNKVPVAITALAALLLVTATFVAVRQARDARQQAAIAQKERDNTRAINDFFRNVLSNANPIYTMPGHGKGPDVKLVDVIREVEKKFEEKFKEQPEVRNDLHYTLGMIWMERGEFESAEPHVRAVMELSRQILGERHPRFINSLGHLGRIEAQKGNHAASIALLRRAIEITRLHHPDDLDFPWKLLGLSQELGRTGKFSEAESLILEARETFRKLLGTEEHYWLAYTFCRLGNLYSIKGELERAQEAYREFLARLRRLPSKHEAGEALKNMGVIDYSSGNYLEAEKQLTEAEKLFSQYLGESFSEISGFLYYLASIHCLQKDYVRAEAEARRALEISQQQNGSDPSWTIVSLGLLSKVLISAGWPDRAAPYLREAVERYRAAPNSSSWVWPCATGMLGECLTLLKRYAEAERFLSESYAGLQPIRGEKSPDMVEARRRLVKLYEAWGKPEQAARFR